MNEAYSVNTVRTYSVSYAGRNELDNNLSYTHKKNCMEAPLKGLFWPALVYCLVLHTVKITSNRLRYYFKTSFVLDKKLWQRPLV